MTLPERAAQAYQAKLAADAADKAERSAKAVASAKMLTRQATKRVAKGRELCLTAEYKVGSYRGRVRIGVCRRCGERKPVRQDADLGRYVVVCKPCRKELER